MLMHIQCSTLFLNMSPLNCSKYFLTALDLSLKKVDDLNFSPTVTYGQTSTMMGSLCCVSVLSSGITLVKD